jgi:hypothetical protein
MADQIGGILQLSIVPNTPDIYVEIWDILLAAVRAHSKEDIDYWL